MKKEDFAIKEIIACARRLTSYKNSEDDIKAELRTLKCALKVYDKATKNKEVDKCEGCPEERNCRPGEEPCGCYELSEAEVVKVYNGERYI